MQQLPWNDLRVVLAVARGQSLSGAAALLGVNATTVSRRLKALESHAKSPLFIRDITGKICLTQVAQVLADHAEGMERYAQAAEGVMGQDTVVGGTVRLTAVPIILNRIITPHIGAFKAAHPALQISLVPDNKNLSLTRREVDLAIRFGKPNEGGSAVLAQRIGKVSFSVFTAKRFLSIPECDRPWLTYDPLAAHLPQAQWTEKLAKLPGQKAAGLLIHDLETAFETILHVPVKGLLPDVIACRDERLDRIDNEASDREMYRDVWLMRHRDMRGVERIDVTTDWVIASKLFD